MKKLSIILVLFIWLAQPALAAGGIEFNGRVRIKELVEIDGLRTVIAKGYGLVVGLPDTGDSDMSRKQLVQSLKNFGIDMTTQEVKNSNSTAIVYVTATIEPFGRKGDMIKLDISTVGDAKSLKGGYLQETHLFGPGRTSFLNNLKLVLAEGPVVGTSVEIPTRGAVSDGGQLLTDMASQFTDRILEEGKFTLRLKDPDFDTTSRIEEKLNADVKAILGLGEDDSFPDNYRLARTLGNSREIEISVPDYAIGNDGVTAFIASVLKREVEVDQEAVVVINERESTFVVTGNVMVLPTTVRVDDMTIDTSAAAGNPKKPFTEISQSSFTGVPLKSLTGDLQAAGWTAKQLSKLIRSIDEAGALKGKLIIQN